MKTYTVKVTKSDINKGRAKDCQYCPIALALKRLFPKRRASVGRFAASAKASNGKMRLFKLPLTAVRLIDGFDIHGFAQPITFQMAKA